LLALARSELQSEKYDLVAGNRARARIGRIPPAQIPDALGMIAAMPGGHDAESALTDALLERWAAHDGRAAGEFSLAHRSPPTMGFPPIRGVLTVWAGQDPQAALAWYVEKSAAEHPGLNEKPWGRWPGIANIRWIMGPWVHRDLEGALAAYRSLESEKHRAGARTAFGEAAGLSENQKARLREVIEREGARN
jgi:hypothetical protein